MSTPVLRVEVFDSVWELLGLRQRLSLRLTARSRDWSVSADLEGGHMHLILTNAQKVSLAIQPLDVYGNPAKIDGAPTWALSDGTLGTLTPDTGDPSRVLFTTGQATGVTQVSVSVDADLGAGVRTISGTLDIQIEPSEAVSVGIVAGVPEPK